ncbi:predicted protein [Naegleria gruberi]|uniref:Predicted protein n=1 Tax=Naegleria gruberi TaxID=5762 RepID=D2W0C5_NAEGR|nr:uncharacterized protein NAEGRDRAFT_53692 [Naegleria gruberi]EFC37409.1 predicted protein [Naegleria gruberi]|eukprot:XP_002670153.1 predicted protein [Naegleria gruberi strain NEG-M]
MPRSSTPTKRKTIQQPLIFQPTLKKTKSSETTLNSPITISDDGENEDLLLSADGDQAHDDDIEISTETVSDSSSKYSIIRTPINDSSTVDELGLESVEAHELQQYFNAEKYLAKEKGKCKKIYCIDRGSSFTKGNKFDILEKRVKPTILKFGHKEKTQFLPSQTFYNLQKGQVKMGKFEVSNEWEELENLKKIFMVSELLEIGLKSEKKKLRVSHIIYLMIRDLISQLLTTKKQDSNYLEGIGAWIFTCPSGTSVFTKLIFRNCIFKAYNSLNINENNPLQIDDIYVIEECTLLKYFANNQEKTSTMFVDLGHLTLDVVVMDLIDGEYIVTFKNGESSGMSLIHQLLKDNGLDSIKEMENLFDNYHDSNELPPSLLPLKNQIDETLKTITKPLCMMILQKQVDSIHFSGAITRVAYFQRKLQENISYVRLQNIKNELLPYLKEEFKNRDIPIIEFLCETTGESALLSGAEEMINCSLMKISQNELDCNVPIIFKEKSISEQVLSEPSISSIPEMNEQTLPTTIDCLLSSISYNDSNNIEQYVPAMLFDHCNSGRVEKKMLLGNVLLDMNIKQDTEIFLIKFSPLIDTKLISTIDYENFEKVGIIEFIRFTNLIICFDCNHIKTTTNLHFYMKLDLEDDFLLVRIYYTKGKSFFKTITRIERKGRNERISINDSAQLIFKTKEDEVRTWYGVYYDTLSIVSSFSSISIKYAELENEIGVEKAKGLHVGSKQLSIPSIGSKDKEFVRKHLSKCSVCQCEIKKVHACISYNKLPIFRKVFDDNSINLGNCCSPCYRIYNDLKKEEK